MYPLNATGDLYAAHVTGVGAIIILAAFAALGAAAALYIRHSTRQAVKDRLRRRNRAQQWDREMVDAEFNDIMRDLVRDGVEE